MRYAQVVPCDVCNGDGVGCSLFVQGCNIHCKGCFNKEAWDFNGGKPWDVMTKIKFFSIVEKPYIKRVSILGGEPLDDANVADVYEIIMNIKDAHPEKVIWLYTGYELDEIAASPLKSKTVLACDVVVVGPYVEELRDITLPWCGSSNQRVIDVKKALTRGGVSCIIGDDIEEE